MCRMINDHPYLNKLLSKPGCLVGPCKWPQLVILMGLSTRAMKPDSLDSDPRCGFNVAHRLRALHCWRGSQSLPWSTVTQHSTHLGSGSRPCGGKVVFGSGFPIRIGFGSKVACGEPQYQKQILTNANEVNRLQQ